MQLLKVAFGYDIGADSHETIEFPLLIQHLVKTVENSELHTLLFGVMFQRRTQIGKIRITQRFVGLLVVQQGYFVRNDDTLGLGAVSQILAGADDRATRLLTHGQRRIAIQQTRHRGLRESRTFRNLLDGRHRSLALPWMPHQILVKALLNPSYYITERILIDMTQPEQSRKPRIAHQSTERMNELHAQQKSFALQNMRSKGLGNAGLPFKATGHKGGISRQGSKRG